MPTDEPVFRVFTPRLWNVVEGEPVGVLHAAPHGSDTTVCGLLVTELLELANRLYHDLLDPVRCAECDKDVRTSRATGERGTLTRAGHSAREIRNWARSNGVDVPNQGRIPTRVREAFDAR